MLMLLAFILFAGAASGGALMSVLVARRGGASAFLGKAHGLTALAGLVLLFIGNLIGEEATPAAAWWAFALFLAGFVGGITVIAQVYQHRPPIWFTAAHGGLALVGLYLLGGVVF